MQPVASIVLEDDELTHELGDLPRTLMSTDGAHKLWLITPDYWAVTGPCPTNVFAGQIPAGNWMTEWSGDEDCLVVHIFR